MIKKIVLSLVLTLAIFNTPVHSKMDGIMVKDKKSSILYEYGYRQLVLEAEYNAVGLESKFYNEYVSINNMIIAFHDDKQGYVSYKSIMNAAEEAVAFNKEFSCQNFINDATEDIKVYPETYVQIRILQGKEVVNGQLRHFNKQNVGFDVNRIY